MKDFATRPLRIAIDLDDVLAALVPAWLNAYNAKYGDALTADQIDEWDIASFATACSKDQFHSLLTPEMYATVEPHAHAAAAVFSAAEYFDVYIVSAPGTYRNIVQVKMDWINQHLPAKKLKDVAFLNDKSRFDCDFLIDDGPHNLRNRVASKSAIMIARPWNHGPRFCPTYISAYNAVIALAKKYGQWAR